jgi:hypothetical protein
MFGRRAVRCRAADAEPGGHKVTMDVLDKIVYVMSWPSGSILSRAAPPRQR